VIYLSKRATPLIEADAMSILDVTVDEYRSALAKGHLRRSIQVDNDPTGRLAFHSFWDLLEFSLARSEAVASEASEAQRRLAAELSDDLAGADNDVAVGTGNPHEDFALIADEWTDEADVSVLPASVVSCYARLLLRTLRHVYSVAEATLLGPEGLLRPCQEQAATASGRLEPLMDQAAA
jgi:hypothetical protein